MSKLLPNVIFGVVGIVVLMALIGGGRTPALEIRRWGAIRADDGFAFDVTNVDHSTITISSAKINDRPDCIASPISFAGEGKFPLQLKVGDKVTFVTTCRVIRVEIETDIGNAEFSF